MFVMQRKMKSTHFHRAADAAVVEETAGVTVAVTAAAVVVVADVQAEIKLLQ